MIRYHSQQSINQQLLNPANINKINLMDSLIPKLSPIFKKIKPLINYSNPKPSSMFNYFIEHPKMTLKLKSFINYVIIYPTH